MLALVGQPRIFLRCFDVVTSRTHTAEVKYLGFSVEEHMSKNAERIRALTTLLRYRGGSITLSMHDAAQSELQRMLQQLVADGLVELCSPSETTVTYRLLEHQPSSARLLERTV